MKKRIFIIVTSLCIIALLFATGFSIIKFRVINPFSSLFGALEIMFTDKEYTVIQNHPTKVIFSKNNAHLLDEYMSSRGYILEEQYGGLLIYSNNIQKEYIFFSMHQAFSQWVWK